MVSSLVMWTHRATFSAQQFGSDAAVIEAIVVINDHAACRQPAIQQIIQREHARVVREVDKAEAVAAPVAVATPVATGGKHHVLRAEVEHVLGSQGGITIDGHIGKLAELAHAPVAHARPFGQARQARLARDAPAQLLACLGQTHLVPTLAKRARRFQPGRTGADHQHAGGRALRRIRSGCQPLRHSSPMVGFCVQRIGEMVMSPERRCCSRCIRGCRRCGLPRSSLAGMDRQSTVARNQSDPARRA